MKSNTLALFLVFSIVILGCTTKPEKGFLINGRISGLDNRYIYLVYGNKIDSSKVLNGSFYFEGKVSYPKKSALYPDLPSSKEQMTIGVLMLENSEIDIVARYSEGMTSSGPIKFLDIDSINGSKSQVLKDHFEGKMHRTVFEEPNDSIKTETLYDNLFEFLSANPELELSGEYLADYSTPGYNLTSDQINNLFVLLDTSYQDEQSLEKISKNISQRKLLEIGNTPPNIVLPDMEGNLLDRKTLKGKIVLLDFWASWCAPCRQANPELLKIYEKSKDKGFEILGISIDENSQKWKEAIIEDGISWLQVLDSLGETKRTYNLNSIPFNILLDREGQIMTVDVNHVELTRILETEL
ncbi:MAG: AhpC/TSA family protein [Muricauda sp.]|nr:TlpA disulfide reductase family protein [Allomuricauda sp.]MBA4746911.1 AhpC/TSA family protein [Allomuricauda sp.]